MLNESNKTSHLRQPSAALILENGEILWGQGLGPKKSAIAELCFNTSQTGYQETLTDPSYAKQIITFTFPHIGIVGTNSNDLESKKIYAEGCIINQRLSAFSSWRGEKSLDFFFNEKQIPCIYNLDTRYLTKKLAKEGAIKAAIVHFGTDKSKLKSLKNQVTNWQGLENLDLASLVSTKNEYEWNENIWQSSKNLKSNYKEYPIVCIDFGIKHNILRSLRNYNFKPTVLNSSCSIDEIMKKKPKGIFLSNGPGDPYATCEIVLPTIRDLIKLKIPIFGICLGHQILSIAFNAKTKKMFQGHRGANHPVKNIINSKVEITSQNHGFEVDRNSFSDQIIETHISLFDGSNEGIKHKFLPIFSVQYHPESSPGPHDSKYLFDDFYYLINKYA